VENPIWLQDAKIQKEEMRKMYKEITETRRGTKDNRDIRTVEHKA